MDNLTCPACGQSLARGVRPMTLRYQEYAATFDMSGWYCDACGEGVHTGADMRESDRQLNRLRARAEHVLLPDEVRRIRKKLGLTQQEAGLLLGGGPNAFYKYERAEVLPSQPISNLLRVLEANPDGLEVLRQRSRASVKELVAV